jgi:hypothetical protein
VTFEFGIRMYDVGTWPGTATVYVDNAELCGTAPPTSTPTPAPTATTCPGIPGDINDDGRITTSDALLCFQIALGTYTPTPEEACRADVNSDGRVTTSDALCIFQEALGIPNECFASALRVPPDMIAR